MKIAITGSAGTGKTALAEQLAERLKLPLVPEHFDSLFLLSGDDAQKPKEMVNTYREVLKTKTAEEDQHADFVSDRCALDLMSLWLMSGLSRSPMQTEKFYNRCRRMASRYDRVVILPWGVRSPKVGEKDGDGDLQVQNPWTGLHVQATIIGLARMWLRRGQLLLVPPNLESLEDRLKFVQAALEQGGRATAS